MSWHLFCCKRRDKRGSIDFDFPESKITLDSKGKPIDVAEYERNNAHRIIEEFMLAANQTVAEDYYWQELPFVYRTHEAPDSEKILQLGIFINNFGYTIKTGAEDEIHPKELQKLISKVEGTPEEGLISRLTLRSMKQAKYTTGCEGHFGLAEILLPLYVADPPISGSADPIVSSKKIYTVP